MSVNDLIDHVEAKARQALFETGALKACRFHPEVTIRVGDENAERHAYARMTTGLKREDEMIIREDVVVAIKEELDKASDVECPECAYNRDKR